MRLPRSTIRSPSTRGIEISLVMKLPTWSQWPLSPKTSIGPSAAPELRCRR
jgi:hypothetical protein